MISLTFSDSNRSKFTKLKKKKLQTHTKKRNANTIDEEVHEQQEHILGNYADISALAREEGASFRREATAKRHYLDG